MYQKIQTQGEHHLKKRPYIAPLFGLLLGFLIVGAIWLRDSSQATFRPSEANVVFLFDQGRRQALNTKAETVGELINRLNLNLIEQDVIEPSLDTPVVEDNLRINIYRARPITIVDGQTRRVILTGQRSPRVVARQANIELKAEDIASFEQGNLRENVLGEKVVIERATAIKLNLYGTQAATYTLAKTVEDLLREKGIKLDHGENVVPALGTPITADMQVFVLSEGASVETTEEEVPVPTETVSDIRLSFGSTAVRQEGRPGKKLVTYLVTNKDGVQTRELIQAAIVVAPVPRIIAKGTTIQINADKTAIMNAAGIAASDHAYVNYIVSRESGWRPTVSGLPPGGPYAGAYGLCQANPGSKMVSAGDDWLNSPVTQLRWCSGYAKSRYGGWAGAYNYWSTNHRW